MFVKSLKCLDLHLCLLVWCLVLDLDLLGMYLALRLVLRVMCLTLALDL